MRVYLKGRGYFAEGRFEDGKVTVSKGNIKLDVSCNFRQSPIAIGIRNNSDYVDSDGIIIKEYTFNSLSTAAQFVTGGSRNGYDVWKIEKGVSLGRYLKEHGLR